MLTMNSRDMDGVSVVRLSGNLDVETHGSFKKKIRRLVDQDKVFILFELKGVDSIDSSGVGALLAIRNTVREYNGDARIVGDIDPKVMEILRLCGLDRVFQRFESVEKGIESYQSERG